MKNLEEGFLGEVFGLLVIFDDGVGKAQGAFLVALHEGEEGLLVALLDLLEELGVVHIFCYFLFIVFDYYTRYLSLRKGRVLISMRVLFLIYLILFFGGFGVFFWFLASSWI